LLRSPRRLPRFATRLRPLDFYDYCHQLIWAALLRPHQRGKAVSVDALLAELSSDARDDDAGGRGYLVWLAERAFGADAAMSASPPAAAPG
jgi:replicative DNA helicase